MNFLKSVVLIMKKGIQLILVFLIVVMLALPVSAVSFTPSVEQKGAPVLGELTDASGAPAAAIVVDTDGNEIMSVSADSIAVTSVVDIQEAPEEVQVILEEAYKSISESKDLETAAPALKEALQQINPDLTVSDLVVCDLFHVAVGEDVAQTIENGGSIILKFDLNRKADELLIVMVYVDGEWIVIDADKVEINEDGEVSVAFDVPLGPIAFVVQKTE